MPKVSILVPVYNVEKYIDRCAISLFEQTFDDIEYVFVNDCSQDNSIDILQKVIAKYPSRKNSIKLVNHTENRGLASARNTAINNAIGDYILHIDSDDYIETNTVKVMYEKAIAENADVVVCNYILEWENANKFVEQVWKPNNIDFLKDILSGEAVPCVWNKLFKRELYINNNIHAIEGLNFGEDFAVTPRLIYFANRICKVDNYFIHYIQSNASAYTKKFNPKHVNNIVSAFEVLENFFQSKDDYDCFKDSILAGKLRKKIELISSASKNEWNSLSEMFPEVSNITSIDFLSKREKLVYFFIKNNIQIKLDFFLEVYKILFNFRLKFKAK